MVCIYLTHSAAQKVCVSENERYNSLYPGIKLRRTDSVITTALH